MSLFATILSMAFIYFITYSMSCLEMLFSNFCLWLTFTFNEKYYRKFCHCCIVLTASAAGTMRDVNKKHGSNESKQSFYMKMDDTMTDT